jgi:hypothetical protein
MGNRIQVPIVAAIALTFSLTGTGWARQDADSTAWPFTRVRGNDPEVRRLIRDATARSKTMLALVEEIQQSNAIVFVGYGQCAKGQICSCVTGVEGDEHHRAIRIVVDSRTTGYGLMATIARELQHAVEIVREPSAVDGATTMALYRRIGTGQCRLGLSERCETELALTAERAVLEELYREAPAARPH